MFILRAYWDELRSILQDKGVLIIFLAGLTIYTLVYPVPYSPEVLKNVPVVPVDLDQSSMSRKLLRWAETAEEIRFVTPAADLAEAQQRVLNAEANGIFVIPKGFERDILRGTQAHVGIYCDATYFLVYKQVMFGLYKATATLSAGIEIRRLSATGLLEKQAMAVRDPAPIVTRPLFNPAGGYASYVVPAALILIIQQTLLIGLGMRGGTRNEMLARLRAGKGRLRGSRTALLIGRGLAYFSIYIFYPAYYMVVIMPIYDLPHVGNPFTVTLFLTPCVLAVTYLGFALNTFWRRREDGIITLVFTSVPIVFLMGFAWPAETLPWWLAKISMLIPCVPGASGFLRLNQMGAPLHEVMPQWFTLWGLVVFYFILARLLTPKVELGGEPVDDAVSADAAVAKDA